MSERKEYREKALTFQQLQIALKYLLYGNVWKGSVKWKLYINKNSDQFVREQTWCRIQHSSYWTIGPLFRVGLDWILKLWSSATNGQPTKFLFEHCYALMI